MDYWNTLGPGALTTGLGSLMGQKNPYGAASQYYDKIPGTISPYYNPYINAGHEALGQLQGQYGNLMNDPNGMYNKLSAGYQKSPGYDFQMTQGMNAANNAAASGGMLGSGAHQQQAAYIANGLASQDFGNYMDRNMNLYGTGLQGMQGINQMGYGASNELAQSLANSLMSQGNLAFSGQASQNKMKGDQFGDIFGGLAMLMM